MHGFSLSIQNVAYRVVFNFLCIPQSKLKISFYILIRFLLNLLHSPGLSFFSSRPPACSCVRTFSNSCELSHPQ